MAWKSKKTIDTTTSIPLGRLARPSEISSYIKKLINASQYDYHESEAFEVTEVILNEPLNRGSVRGSFINNPNQEILGGVVKPLMPNVVAVPVIGEHVVVVEYNGQHYYTSIINRKGSINENSIPGATGNYVKDTKYGKTFERKKVKQLEIGEGCILYEGRFGQSVHFDGHDNVPSIKIRTNIDTGDGDFTSENIDTDDSSIYLTSAGLKGEKFDNQEIEGKKILIKSNGIFIKGSGEKGEVRVIGDESINLNSNAVNLGNGANQSVVRGDDLKSILDEIISVLSSLASGLNSLPPTLPLGGVQIGAPIVALVNQLKIKLNTSTMLSTKVKTG